jgi:hypothetical protein
MHRRTFDTAGAITNSHGDYPAAIRQTAKEENVPLVDLTEMSRVLYERLGKEGSGILFKDGDGTHHNAYGSYELARCIVESIRQQRLSLAKYLVRGLRPFDPRHPDPPTSLAIPPSPSFTAVKPLGN